MSGEGTCVVVATAISSADGTAEYFNAYTLRELMMTRRTKGILVMAQINLIRFES